MIKILLSHLKSQNKYLFSVTLIFNMMLLAGCQQSEFNYTLIDGKPTSPLEVAMLLPLESADDSTNELAQTLANAARLATNDLKGTKIKLSIYPTSGDKTRATHAARFAIANGAQIIVGPFFSDETLAVKKAMLKENIKIISLSNDPTVAGGQVYILGTTFKTVADRIIKYAMSHNFKRIAVVSPEGSIGLSAINAVKKSARENGATIVAIRTYPLSFEGMEKTAPEIYRSIIKSKTDAIIFTDTVTRGLGFISELLNKQFLREGRSPAKFLGLTRWDMARQTLLEPSLQHGWFVLPDQKLKRAFETRYSNEFGVMPSQMSALSYDSIALIGSLMQLSETKSDSSAFNDANFTHANGFVGINGVFRFKKDGVNERLLSIAEVNNGSIRIIEHAKTYFE